MNSHHGRGTRWRIGAVAVAIPLALGVSVRLLASSPPLGVATPAAVTTIVDANVARPGDHLVVVRFPIINDYESVIVSVGSRHTTANLSPSSSAAVALYLRLISRRFAVRAVTSRHIPFSVATAAVTAPSTADTSPTLGATATTRAIRNRYLTAPPKGPYNTLVWSDEFTGAARSRPKAAKWELDSSASCGPDTQSTFTQNPANASLDGRGGLRITALAGPNGYTSAQLDTAHKLSFRYGRFEARIQPPAGRGLCSAFWLLGDHTSHTAPLCWPSCGEIDIMETVGQLSHWSGAFLHGPVSGSANFQQWGSSVTAQTPFTAAYHTYGLIWQRNSLTWTLDGVVYARATPADLPASAKWVFNSHTAHLLLELAVGGWEGPPDVATTFPATLRVDWVRVYQ
jgi:beta-glucanase (GH16 family)